MNTLGTAMLLFICLIVFFATGQILAARMKEECPALYAQLRGPGVLNRIGAGFLAFVFGANACSRAEGKLSGLIWAFRAASILVALLIADLLIG